MRSLSVLSILTIASIVFATPLPVLESFAIERSIHLRDAMPEPISLPEPVIKRDPEPGCGTACTREAAAEPEPVPEDEPESFEERGCGHFCIRDPEPEPIPEPEPVPVAEPGCGRFCIREASPEPEPVLPMVAREN
ncbi:hypothetical protein EW145_g2734 [Phellinidium pouzarii]|uniref:Uncharacterized protein n=1 Tax=Phellinidium pouzarii TaxID=167371 RepID=A0A4S4L9Y3_9AGAM|nr:hypothetical protein EW145_g2734 [Phellinidium pouzarii]